MLIYLFIGFLMFVVYKFNVVQTVNNTIIIKRRKLHSLSQLVRTQYKNIFMIFWVCMCIIAKNFYLSVLQFFIRSVRHVGKNVYEVSYVINGIKYTMRVRPRKGPPVLIQALDQNDNDVTDVIQEYLGPHDNFHGCDFKPGDFGFTSLTLNTSAADEVTFGKDEKIVVCA